MQDIAEARLRQAGNPEAARDWECSGLYALHQSREAFAARALLARAAARTLDVQCYIWRGDTTGQLLLEELWNAAERGVRVRLLLDDNGVDGLDPTLAALDRHPNMEVRLFNPYAHRRYKALGLLTDFRRLNRRMHNKSFTADGEATIVGGRNVGDEYFGVDPRMRFVDLDVMAVGPIARDVSAAFDRYWNAESVRRVTTVIGIASAESVRAMQDRFAAVRASAAALAYAEAVRATRMVEALFANELELEWARVRLVCDPPNKVKDQARGADLIYARLLDALGEPERSVDIISPYFVPGRKGRRALARVAERGVTMRIVTNSLAATDVSMVHAGYAKHRLPLLRSHARIYEFKPDGHIVPRAKRVRPRPRRRVGSAGGSRSASSLHIKTISVDACRVFVGSLNLDPRSIRLNTEMGLVIESAAFAREVAERVDDAVATATYEVVVAKGGHRLEWIEPGPEGETRHRREPRTGFLKRLSIQVMARMPIEWLL